MAGIKTSIRKPAEPKGLKTSRRSLLTFAMAASLIAAATIAAYWGIGAAGFISFDDPAYVTGNYHVRQGLTWAGAKWAFGAFEASNWHPLTWLSHMLDVQFFGLRPAGHHIVNLVFHAANSILLLAFLYVMTGRLWPSAFVAALFALHPLHVESVAWVSERKDVLSTFFWLLTMLAWAWYAGRPGVWRYAVVVAFFAMGLAAKPMLVTLPVVLLLVDRWPLGRELPTGRLIIEKLPLVAMSVASCMVTLAAQKQAMYSPEAKVTAVTLANAVVSYGRYIWQMLWPAKLSIYYPLSSQPLLAAGAAIMVCIIAVTVLVVRCRARYPYLMTGWLWYLVTLVPVIGFLQVGDQSHADRYTYIPLVGIFIAGTFWAAEVTFRRPLAKWATVAAAIMVLAAFTAVTRYNVAFWKDSYTLFSHAESVVDECAKVEISFGASLWQMGRDDEAIEHLNRAVRCDMHDGSAFAVLGRVYSDRGDTASASRYFGEATKYRREAFEGHFGLGGVLLQMKDYNGAISHLRAATELDRYSGKAQSIMAMALAEAGQSSEAERAMLRARELEPENALTLYAQGYVLARGGDLAGAAEQYKKSIAAEPSFPAYRDLGLMLERIGRADEAREAIRAALAVVPNDAECIACYRRLGGER